MTTQFKVGDLVRVPSRRKGVGCYGHSLPQGSVCEVLRIEGNGDVQLQHPGPLKYQQIVHSSMLKPAKQAMAERKALRLLDAGNIPKPGNKSPVANRMRKHIQAYVNRRG